MTACTPIVKVIVDIGGTPTEVDITHYCRSISINRGRTTRFGEIPAGTMTISAHNYTRNLDPSYTSSPFFGKIAPGNQIAVKVTGTDYHIFSGYIADYDYSYDVDGVSMTTITAVDYLATLARKVFVNDVTPAWSETTGERIANLLNLPEIDMLANAQLDDGVSTLQADIIEAGTNALSYIQLLARTEVGQLFAAADQPAIMFRDRNFAADLGTMLTVSEDPVTGVPFSEVDVKMGSDVLYTQVIVSRVDGSTETFTDDDAVEVYGILSTGSEYTGLLLEDDTQSYDIGLMLIGTLAEPVQQFSRFLINLPRLNLQEINVITGLEIGYLVHATFTPDGIGAPIDQYCVVEGIRHNLSPGEYTVELFVSKSAVQEF